MTAIFTGFTPTKPACEPIANPKPTKTTPEVIEAEDSQGITSSVIGALPVAGVGAPVSKTAQAKPSVAAPSSKAAQTAVTIPAPSEKTAQAKASIGTPSNLGAEDTATVSAPSSKTAQVASAIPLPTEKTAQAKATISAPSSLAGQNRGSNLFVYSEQIDNGVWGKTELVVTPNAAIAPDGTLTADRLTDTAVNNLHRAFQTVTGQTAGDKVTVSFYAKAESLSKLELPLSISGADMSSSAVFDLTARSVSGGDNSRIVDAGDGWYRCSATYTVNTTGAVTAQILLVKGNQSIYAGSGESLLLWGAQFEKASTVNAYVKTEASAVSFVPAVNAPSAKTTEAKPDISAPSSLGAESKASIPTPSSKTAETAATVPAPSSKAAQAKATVPTPSAKSAESKAVTPAPSTLTANPATEVAPPFPLNHARILYENVLQSYNSITDTGPTGTAENAVKPNTWERWKFSTAANTLVVDFSTAVDFDTVCIASHNLSNAGATIEVYYEPEPGGVFVKLGEKTPTNNEPICFYSETLLDALTIEIRISGASGVPQIGYISAGESLQMQRPFFNGHIPITDGDVTEYYSNRTESGEIIGQSIRRQGYQTNADWRYIDDTWYRNYFDPFKKVAKLTPFFFMWNLLEYPDDVGFCRISQDINCPMQNGFTTKRTISMTLLGAG